MFDLLGLGAEIVQLGHETRTQTQTLPPLLLLLLLTTIKAVKLVIALLHSPMSALHLVLEPSQISVLKFLFFLT